MTTQTTITDILHAGQHASAVRHYRLEATEEPDLFDVIAIEAATGAATSEGHKRWPVGRIGVQQGDVYFQRLAALPPTARPLRQTDGQLVPDNTQGSRHCVDPTRCSLYALPRPTALQGPVIDTSGPITITHPEHGHITLPAGIYQVTYQRSFADELRRVAD